MLKHGKQRKRTSLWLMVGLGVWLWLGALPATQGFMAYDHQRLFPEHLRRKMNNLIRRVHKAEWVIGYRYMDNCPPKSRNNGKAIEEAITTSLRAWLKPVRDLNTGKPVVDDFRFVPDFEIKDRAELKLYDLTIYFYCDFGQSSALVAAHEIPPAIKLHRGTVVDNHFKFSLLHEIGHAFGLLDTYRRNIPGEEFQVSRGGLVGTIGHQPASVMSGLNSPRPLPTRISQDDANGIVWLYKFYHENLPLEDCIFPEYELEKSPDGCRPKSPLIFEIKHGDEDLAIKVIREDENTDINAKDGNGMTALDYALAKGYNRLVDRLVIHPKIDVNVRNVEGSTPLFWAAKRGNYGLTERLFRFHTIDVNIRNTDGTTPLKVASTGGHTRIVALLLSQEQDEGDWTPVTKESPSHHRSVFYLLYQPGSDPPQLFHVGYLGTLPDGAALFAAQNAIEKYLKAGDFSLVGYQGLVSADINVRVLGSFPGRNGKTGNVLLSVRGVDLSGYEPLSLAVYPTLIETEIELLTYKFGAGIMLEGRDVDKALNIALRSRSCVSVPNMELAGMDLGQHTCGPPNSVAVGSLLFDKANQTLIGFYRTQEGASILGDGLPLADGVPEGLIRLIDAKPVPPKNTLATLWGAIKTQ